MGILDWITGSSKKEELMEFISNGAKIIDVRSAAEFNSGHANHSINIALDRIKNEIPRIKKLNSPIILVCRSGSRASTALSILKSHGIKAMNAGSWNNVA